MACSALIRHALRQKDEASRLLLNGCDLIQQAATGSPAAHLDLVKQSLLEVDPALSAKSER